MKVLQCFLTIPVLLTAILFIAQALYLNFHKLKIFTHGFQSAKSVKFSSCEKLYVYIQYTVPAVKQLDGGCSGDSGMRCLCAVGSTPMNGTKLEELEDDCTDSLIVQLSAFSLASSGKPSAGLIVLYLEIGTVSFLVGL